MCQDLAAQSLQGTTKCSMLTLLHCSEGKMQRQTASRKMAVPWRVDVSTSPCIWAPPGRLPVSEKSLAHFKNQDLGSFWASHWKRQITGDLKIFPQVFQGELVGHLTNSHPRQGKVTVSSSVGKIFCIYSLEAD